MTRANIFSVLVLDAAHHTRTPSRGNARTEAAHNDYKEAPPAQLRNVSANDETDTSGGRTGAYLRMHVAYLHMSPNALIHLWYIRVRIFGPANETVFDV